MSQRYLGGIITANPTTPTMTSESGVWTLEQQFQYSSTWSPEIVGNSLRFRSSASAYLNRTFGSPTAQNTWTLSFWTKRGSLGSLVELFSAGTANRLEFLFAANNTFQIADASTNFIITSAVFRDPSAWYHIVVRANGSGSALQVYVNGVVTTNSTTNNLTTSYWNASGTVGYIGALGGYSSNYYDGYMAEVYFVDGQALTPSSFGAFDSTGVWQPLAYTGTYGTNGFYIDFSDNSAATAAALGKDYSGNGNNWTPNNISLTAGSTYDWMLDSPTNQSNSSTGIGNYCTLNPLDFGTIGGGSFNVPTNGNLDWTGNSTGDSNIKATIAVSSGKWYAEFTNLASAAIPCVVTTTTSNTANSFPNQAGGYGYLSSAQKANNGTYTSYGATYTSSDVIGIALDLDAGTVTFYKNGASQGQAFSGLSGTFTFGISDTTYAAITANANFGQRPFAYTPPTGYLALNTQNLSTPTITSGGKYMSATTYAGSASQQVINSNMTALDFAWIKNRTTARDHVLVDTVRGGSPMLTLYSDLTAAEDNSSPNYNPTSISGSSITLGGAKLGINNASENFVMWGWTAGAGTTSSNTSGSITSTVSVNTTAGFSVVTYTGTGANATVGHGLGVAPSLVIVKSRTGGTSSWAVWITGFSGTEYLLLESTAAKGSAASVWNSTVPNSTVVSIGTGSVPNNNGWTYVMYCWAAVAGYSAFGSYTGNGANDGPFVYCGFRPRWVMVKRTDTAGFDWFVWDSSRSTYNAVSLYLNPDTSGAEGSGSGLNFVSNGFKWYNDTGTSVNASGATYIYAAFAENPFRIARAR